MAFRDVYRPTATDSSRDELLRFGRWLNTVYGYHPIIVGGWAVFFYARSLGSKDIDVILPTRVNVDRIMVQWYDVSGFESRGDLERIYFKQVETGEGTIRVDMDVASYADKNSFREDPSLDLPWILCESHFVAHREGDADFRLPSPELLLAYKTKALRDRRYRLGKEVLSTLQRDVLSSKIWKDEHDIRELERVGADPRKCVEIVGSRRIADLIRGEWRRLNAF